MLHFTFQHLHSCNIQYSIYNQNKTIIKTLLEKCPDSKNKLTILHKTIIIFYQIA